VKRFDELSGSSSRNETIAAERGGDVSVDLSDVQSEGGASGNPSNSSEGSAFAGSLGKDVPAAAEPSDSSIEGVPVDSPGEDVAAEPSDSSIEGVLVDSSEGGALLPTDTSAPSEGSASTDLLGVVVPADASDFSAEGAPAPADLSKRTTEVWQPIRKVRHLR
jgi:hypothetical protein